MSPMCSYSEAGLMTACIRSCHRMPIGMTPWITLDHAGDAALGIETVRQRVHDIYAPTDPRAPITRLPNSIPSPSSACSPRLPHDKRSRDIVAWAIGNTRGVRLEDLHQRPRATLEKVRAWLGVDWHDALLHSTFDGQPWHHRTTGGQTVKGFQQTTITKKHADIFTPLDRIRLKLLFADQCQAWNYPIPRIRSWRPLAYLSAILWLLPLRMESSIWRAQPWRGPRTLGGILSSYIVVRLKILSRWWPDLKRRPPLIRLLD